MPRPPLPPATFPAFSEHPRGFTTARGERVSPFSFCPFCPNLYNPFSYSLLPCFLFSRVSFSPLCSSFFSAFSPHQCFPFPLPSVIRLLNLFAILPFVTSNLRHLLPLCSSPSFLLPLALPLFPPPSRTPCVSLPFRPLPPAPPCVLQVVAATRMVKVPGAVSSVLTPAPDPVCYSGGGISCSCPAYSARALVFVLVRVVGRRRRALAVVVGWDCHVWRGEWLGVRVLCYMDGYFGILLAWR